MAEPRNPATFVTSPPHPDLGLLKLARSVRLERVRSLVSLIHESGPLTYTQLQQAAEDAAIITTQGGTFPKKSTYYHVVKAAVLQGMIKVVNGQYALSAAGAELASLTHSESQLSEPEKAAFRKAFLASADLQPFFSLFGARSTHDVRTAGRAILIRPLPATRLNDRRQTPYEITSPIYGTIELSHVLTHAIVWGVRLWCLEAGLFDELLVAERNHIAAGEVQILFPIMEPTSPQCSPEVVATNIAKYFWPIAARGSNFWKASIPELLYRMCPAEGLSVEAAKAGLAYWIRSHPSSVYTEVVSPSVSSGSWVRGHLEDARFLTQLRKSYLRTENGYCSHIAVLFEAVRKGEIIRD